MNCLKRKVRIIIERKNLERTIEREYQLKRTICKREKLKPEKYVKESMSWRKITKYQREKHQKAIEFWVKNINQSFLKIKKIIIVNLSLK